MFTETPSSVTASTISYLQHCSDENTEAAIDDARDLGNLDTWLGVTYVNSRTHYRSSMNDDHIMYQHIEVTAGNLGLVVQKLDEHTIDGVVIPRCAENITLCRVKGNFIFKISMDGSVFYGTEHFARSFQCGAAVASALLLKYHESVEIALNKARTFDVLCKM